MHQQVLKGIHWLLLKNPENLQQNEQVNESQRLEDALKLNRSLAIAYYLEGDLFHVCTEVIRLPSSIDA